jgi:DNA-binding FadR family transcriptional regulator
VPDPQLTQGLVRDQSDLDAAKKERLGDRIYGQILQQIASGALRPGDRLPSENQICQTLNVSRPVVRQALMRLQADGLVITRKGLARWCRTPRPKG